MHQFENHFLISNSSLLCCFMKYFSSLSEVCKLVAWINFDIQSFKVASLLSEIRLNKLNLHMYSLPTHLRWLANVPIKTDFTTSAVLYQSLSRKGVIVMWRILYWLVCLTRHVYLCLWPTFYLLMNHDRKQALIKFLPCEQNYEIFFRFKFAPKVGNFIWIQISSAAFWMPSVFSHEQMISPRSLCRCLWQ